MNACEGQTGNQFGEAAAIVTEKAGAALRTASVILMDALTQLRRFAVAWSQEFVHLMRTPDTAFPGRHDKLVWVLLFLVVPPIGLWTYRSYREARSAAVKPPGFDDLSDPN